MKLEEGLGAAVTPGSQHRMRSGIRGCRVLMTGFGAFPGVPFNPTAGLATELAAMRRPALENVLRTAHVFETSYAAVERALPALLAQVRPDVMLLFGLATRTPYLRIETRALNRRSALFADVQGCHPTRVAITARAPLVMRGNAPHQRLAIAARRAGVPARLSHDAGSYLCNYIYWRALELTACQPLVQFVHVPMLRGESHSITPPRALSLDDLTRASAEMLMVMLAAARNRACLEAPRVARGAAT